ncbi:MAG: cell division protein FtsA [Firmicutes bacterium]|nr:cell division protein FtsA [Bacillota bacterium]
MMKHIYTSLDIGSDTIKIVVCELYQNKLNLLAASSFKSKGIKKGLITDVELATECIRGAFNEVEEMLGIKIKRVITSVPSFNAEYSIIKGNIRIVNEEGIVTSNDIIKTLEVAAKAQPYSLREMVTILPIDYTVDDKAFIKNPKGMKCSNLGCRAVLVTTPKKNVYSVIGLLESIGIEVVDITLNNIGDLYSFNNKAFEDKVGAIINIGSEVTDVSLYNKSILVKSSIINMGGKNIDNDISYMYKVDIPTAKNLKLKFALAHKNNASVNDVIEVKSAYDANLKINQFELSEVVMSRLEEILNEAKKEINLLTSKKIDYIIITGGTSNMSGIEYVVRDVFGDNANIGNVKMLGIRDNMYSSCVGNIVYFISKLKLKEQDYSMINDNEVYQMISINSKKLNTSDSMLGKIFGFFFSE